MLFSFKADSDLANVFLRVHNTADEDSVYEVKRYELKPEMLSLSNQLPKASVLVSSGGCGICYTRQNMIP